MQAVDNVNNKLADELCGMDSLDQVALDHRMNELDGTENKKSLGANAILGVSLATAQAAADHCGLPLFRYLGGVGARLLPAPMMNIINGGSHADNAVDVQEFMVMPLGVDCFSDAIRCGCEVFHNLKKVLHSKKLSTNVGDEGGFAPDLKSNADALEVIMEAIGKAGYEAGKQAFIALDPAASEFYNADKKRYSVDGKEIEAAALVDLYAKWVDKYPICSIEDGFAEDDWDGWKLMTERLGNKIQLVGDDIFVTNTKRFQRGIDEGMANSILIKVNQIGTLDRDDRGRRSGPAERLHQCDQPPQRRDRGFDDRRPGRGLGHRPDQDRLGLADRPHGQVQPVAADRRDFGRGGALRRPAVSEEAVLMNKIQRVTAVMEGRPPDRPPVSFWYHFAPEAAAGPAAVEAHLRHVETYDLDFLELHERQPLSAHGPAGRRGCQRS